MKLDRVVIVGALAALSLQACAGARVGGSVGNGSGSGSGSSTTSPPSGGGGAGAGGRRVLIDLDASVLTPPDTKKMDLAPDTLPFAFDDAGNPVCLSIVSLGRAGNHGDNINAFQAFMNDHTKNDKTGTTSTMVLKQTYTPITEEFLSHYNVLVLQALNDGEYSGPFWKYQPDEVAAVEKWVKAGGAIIAMSGYGQSPDEVDPLNQLLAFSGISYNKDDTFGTCPENTCYCADNTKAFEGWLDDCADCKELRHGLGKVGLYHGRSVNCTGADCQIFAKDSAFGNVGAAKAVEKGRVVAWGDEWVTYTNQWGLTETAMDTNPQCKDYTARNSYKVPQFWYNVLFWAVPAMQWCFTITLPPTADQDQQIIVF